MAGGGHLVGIAAGSLLVALCWARTAMAFDEPIKEATLRLSRDAMRAFNSGDYRAAAHKFRQALDAIPVPVLALWAARSAARAGDLLSAKQLYGNAIGLAPNEMWRGSKQQDAQAEAAADLAKLLPRIPILTIRVSGAGAMQCEATLDGAVLPADSGRIMRELNPGQHVARVVCGTIRVERTIEALEGQQQTRILDVRQPSAKPASRATPAPQSRTMIGPPSNGWRSAGWVGISIGSAGFLVGAVSGLVAWGRYSDMKGDCSNGLCDPTATSQGDIDSYNRLRWASTTGFASAAVFGALGTSLLLTRPRSSSEPSPTVNVSLGRDRAMLLYSGVY